MERLYFKGSTNLLTEDYREINQDFYLVENLKNCDSKETTYGIKMIQKQNEYLVEENSDPISYSKDYVEELIHRFMERKISVISLNEIVDDLVSEKIWAKEYRF